MSGWPVDSKEFTETDVRGHNYNTGSGSCACFLRLLAANDVFQEGVTSFEDKAGCRIADLFQFVKMFWRA